MDRIDLLCIGLDGLLVVGDDGLSNPIAAQVFVDSHDRLSSLQVYQSFQDSRLMLNPLEELVVVEVMLVVH